MKETFNFEKLSEYLRAGTPQFIITLLRKTKRFIIARPNLRYMELHLTDHCNLNCKGCGHFCPIAEKWFLNEIDYEKDLRQLNKMFFNIEKIRLMGGEPLLHPNVELFIITTRKYFPKTDLRIVTNGILIPKMSKSFWNVCLENHIIIDLTIYPPFVNQASSWIELIQKKGLTVRPNYITDFFSFLNLEGNTNKNESFEKCSYGCIQLYKGKIYVCGLPAQASYFNKTFHTNIPDNGGINIYEANMTGWKILDFFEMPIDTCKFCSLKLKYFPWDYSNKECSEWNSK